MDINEYHDQIKDIDLTPKTLKQEPTFIGTLRSVSDSVLIAPEAKQPLSLSRTDLLDLIKSIDLSTLKVTENKGKFCVSHNVEGSSFHLSVSSRDAKIEGNKELVINGNMTLELTSRQVDDCTEELKKYFAVLNTEE